MKQLGDTVDFYHAGWPLTGTVVQVTNDPGLGVAEYVVQCDKFLGLRFHLNKDDQIMRVQNVLQSK